MSTPTDFRAVLAALPPRDAGAAADVVADVSSSRVSADGPHPANKPWQFSLRQLLGWLAGLSALFAVLAAVGGALAAIIVWILVLAAVHVAANAWGTRTWQPGAMRDEPAAHCPPRRYDAAHLAHAAPQSRISGEIRVNWTMIGCTVCGALVGLAVGGYVLLLAYGHTGKYGAIGFGATAATVLGAFLGFLSSSFLDVTLRTLWEATRQAKPVPAPAIRPAARD